MSFSHAKVDWDLFNAIHSGRTREAFQQLTEQLFCHEYNQPYGIFRFYNHPYLETEPVRVGREYIGFQSKYYDASTNLSSKKNDLISDIRSAKASSPNLTKIVYYINKEFGLSTQSKKEPKYKTEIESEARALGVTIDWRSPNMIETMLLKPELEIIRDYFFSVNDGIRDFLSQLELHKKSILNSIQTSINYGEKTVVVHHTAINLKDFIASGKDALFICGKSGTGKSALMKETFSVCNEYVSFIFRASDFNHSTLSETSKVFGNTTWDTFLDAFDDESIKFCVIDSVEKILTFGNKETLLSAIRMFREHKWRIVFTIRNDSLKAIQHIIEFFGSESIINLEPISLAQLKSISESYGFSLPSNRRLCTCLTNLFYLRLYLSGTYSTVDSSVEAFEEIIWEQYICGDKDCTQVMKQKRAKAITDMVKLIYRNGVSYLSNNDCADFEAMESLRENEIILFDESIDAYYFSHDVFEEIVAKRIIRQCYQDNHNGKVFFGKIGNSLFMRKIFRMWLSERLLSNNDIVSIVLNWLSEIDIEICWYNEILVSILMQKDISKITVLRSFLEKDDYNLLFTAMRMLHTACKSFDEKLYSNVDKKLTSIEHIQYRFTKPEGAGWEFLILFIYNNRETIQWDQQKSLITINVLLDWTDKNKEGTCTRQAGLLAIYLLKLLEKEFIHSSTMHHNKLYSIIASSALEIKQELTAIFDIYISSTRGSSVGITRLIDFIVKDSFNSYYVAMALPEKIIELLKHRWLVKKNDSQNIYKTGLDDLDFGIENNIIGLPAFPSAFITPIYALLKNSQDDAIMFVLEIMNGSTDIFSKSKYGAEECFSIELPIDDRTITQIACERLWNIHRGTSVAPQIIECTMIAFEKYLLDKINQLDLPNANALCRRILEGSRSVAITAVIVSLVEAYPQKLYPTALQLISCISLFHLDNYRFVSESEAGFLLGVHPTHSIYEDERITSNNYKFRKTKLEDIIVKYQLNYFAFDEETHGTIVKKIRETIDRLHEREAELSESERMLLHRIDLRNSELEITECEDGKLITITPKLPDDLERSVAERKENRKSVEQQISLVNWYMSRINKKQSETSPFDQNPEGAFELAHRAVQNNTWQFPTIGIYLISAIIICEYSLSVKQDTLVSCAEYVIEYAETLCNKTEHPTKVECNYMLTALAKIAATENTHLNCNDTASKLIIKLLLDYSLNHFYVSPIVRNVIWKSNASLAKRIVASFAILKPIYDMQVRIFSENAQAPAFFKENDDLINSVFSKSHEIKQDMINALSNNAKQSLIIMLPIESNDWVHEVVLFTRNSIWQRIFNLPEHFQKANEDYSTLQDNQYIDWLSQYLISASTQKLQEIMQELLLKMSPCKNLTLLIEYLLFYAIKREQPDALWDIWRSLYSYIKECCINDRASGYRVYDGVYFGTDLDSSIHTLLFAGGNWGKEEHTCSILSKDKSIFFSTVVSEIGFHPATLYAISRMLCTVGYVYEENGIQWLSDIINKNAQLSNMPLPIETELYMENYVCRFIEYHKSKIKQSSNILRSLYTVLEFLVNRGSSFAYILLEEF